MDSYAIAKAESRIQQLEHEVHLLRLDMDVRESNEKARRIRWEADFFFRLFMTGTLGISALLWIIIAINKT